MSTQRTAQELADDICREVAELPDRSSPEDWPEAMLVTQDELRRIVLAALASQAEPVADDIVLPELPEYTKFGEYYNGHDILGFEGDQLEEFARAAVIADRQRRTTPAPAQAEPIDMVLHCPNCGMQHLDGYEGINLQNSDGGSRASWANPPHRSHFCHCCGHIWRPADVPTNGVQAVKTKGKADSPIVQPAQAERAAVKTLENMGYTYHGAELWKPPLCKPPRFAPAQAEQSEPVGTSIGAHALADELRKAVRDDEDYGTVNYPLRDGVFGPRVTAWLRKVAAEYLRGAVSAEQSEDGRDADPLQGAANWIADSVKGCDVGEIQWRLLVGYNRASRLYDAAIAAKEQS